MDTPAPVMTSRRSEVAMKSASARISVVVGAGHSAGAVDGRRLPQPAEAMADDSLDGDVEEELEEEEVGPTAAADVVAARRLCVAEWKAAADTLDDVEEEGPAVVVALRCWRCRRCKQRCDEDVNNGNDDIVIAAARSRFCPRVQDALAR